MTNMATPQRLTQADYAQAAKILGTGIAEVKAVTQVESGGKGFLADGRVIIRFEPHIFHQKTKGTYSAEHPDVSFPVRKKGYPRSEEHSWQLFRAACLLDATAAVLSTSWGMFQIMGFNFSAAECKNLTEFVARMEKSEGEHLTLFCNLLLSWSLNDELQRHEWATFARIYNGPGYKSNNYDTELDIAYRHFSKA